MKTKRIWIDMTDLQAWSGHMTGIQRVIYQTAVRFAASKKYDTRFFVFHETHAVFVEADFTEIRHRIEVREIEKSGSDDQSGGEARTIKQLLKAAPQALVRRIPDPVKQKVPVEIKQGLRASYHLGMRALRKTHRVVRRRLQPQPPESLHRVTFTAEDTVLILGKTWDFPELIPALGRLKQRQHFKLVHLIHDMIPIFEPHLFGHGLFEPYTRCMFDVCSISDQLLAQSKATKKDVQRFCSELTIPEPPIHLIRLGDELPGVTVSTEPAPEPRLKKGNFILQVGTIETRKNHQLMYMTYREAALKGVTLPYWVIMGGRGWLTGDVIWQMEHDPLVKDRIVMVGSLPDRQKVWLYQNCRLTVVPSTYEGWGMMIGESLGYGKVCVASNTSSLPEVGGKLADYVSPYNTQEMLDALIRYNDPATLKAREKEINAYKPTSWDETYEDIVAGLKS